MKIITGCVIAAFSMMLVSCEDEELVQKNEQLRQKISELEKENDILQINAGEDPGDKSAEIKRLNSELEKTVAEIKALDAEREKLEEEHQKTEKAFRAYQKKYPVE